MNLSEARLSTILGKARVVAGEKGLSREISWAHIVDMPDVLSWVGPGQFLLTTGYAWPRDESGQRMLIRALAEQNLAGIGLAVPRFFDRFPAAFCDEANRLNLPLLEIPWEIPFSLITEELHTAILAEQSRLIEQSEIIHRTLTRAATEASSLQDLAQTLGELIHRSVTFEDQEGRVLGFYTIEAMVDDARRASLEHGYTPPELMGYLDSLGYLQAINNASLPIRIPPLLEHGFSGRIVCPIRLKGETVGKVWIIEGDHPLSDLDLRAAEHAAIVGALQISHQRALASLEARVGYSFVTALLEGRFESTPQTLERAQLQGFFPHTAYRVGMFVLNEEIPLSREALIKRERFAERLREQLQLLGESPLISVSLNQIPFLLSKGFEAEPIWRLLGGHDCAFGLSRAYSGVTGIHKGYGETLAILPHLSFGVFQRYEELLLPRVLLGEPEARAAFLQEMFGGLSQLRNGDLFVKTVIAFAQSGFHLKHTAEALHIHPKSLRYRLEKAAEHAHLDFADPEVRFRLQLAAHLLQLAT